MCSTEPWELRLNALTSKTRDVKLPAWRQVSEMDETFKNTRKEGGGGGDDDDDDDDNEDDDSWPKGQLYIILLGNGPVNTSRWNTSTQQ